MTSKSPMFREGLLAINYYFRVRHKKISISNLVPLTYWAIAQTIPLVREKL